MKSDGIINQVMNTPSVKNLGLKKDPIEDIINSYLDIVFEILLENGHIELGSGIMIEVVKLLDRVHVLRGISYKSSRKYKLKLTVSDDIYKKIESYYNQLEEDIS